MSFVYFVRCPANGLVKIGLTKGPDPSTRIELLFAASPVPIEVLGVVPGDREFELAMHVAFAASWHHNEWFEPSPEMLAFIEREVPAWDPFFPIRDLVASEAARKAKLVEEHGRIYGSAGCTFVSACPDCGEFMGPDLPGLCYGCKLRRENEASYR